MDLLSPCRPRPALAAGSGVVPAMELIYDRSPLPGSVRPPATMAGDIWRRELHRASTPHPDSAHNAAGGFRAPPAASALPSAWPGALASARRTAVQFAGWQRADAAAALLSSGPPPPSPGVGCLDAVLAAEAAKTAGMNAESLARLSVAGVDARDPLQAISGCLLHISLQGRCPCRQLRRHRCSQCLTGPLNGTTRGAGSWFALANHDGRI